MYNIQKGGIKIKKNTMWHSNWFTGNSCLTACNGDGIGAEGISKEEYEQIRPGMTITDVNEIVGGNGERISEKDEKDTIGIIEYIYKYQGENTGYALITFTSDYSDGSRFKFTTVSAMEQHDLS